MNIIKNEKGVALVMAMVMLVLMSILGALALSTSTTEIGISGNYKSSQVAFYTADAAVERAQTDSSIYTSTALLTTNSWNNGASWSIGSGTSAGTSNVTVTYLTCSTSPPRSSGSSAGETGVGYRYYLAAVTAAGPNNSEYNVESQLAREGGACPS